MRIEEWHLQVVVQVVPVLVSLLALMFGRHSL